MIPTVQHFILPFILYVLSSLCLSGIPATPSTYFNKSCNYVFFTDTKTGNERYVYISNGMSWSAAQSYCRTYYTDLASARDATENLVIAGMIPGLTWFGLFRDKWKWIDKNNFSTTSWLSANINNAMGNEDCGFLTNSQAADAKCSDIMPFFCYAGEIKFHSVSYLDQFYLHLKKLPLECNFRC